MMGFLPRESATGLSVGSVALCSWKRSWPEFWATGFVTPALQRVASRESTTVSERANEVDGHIPLRALGAC